MRVENSGRPAGCPQPALLLGTGRPGKQWVPGSAAPSRRLRSHTVTCMSAGPSTPPAADTNYVLEASETVRSTNWVLVPQVPSVEGDKRVVTEEISGPQKFYRLRRP